LTHPGLSPLSLHDALPISNCPVALWQQPVGWVERGETDHLRGRPSGGFRFALPTLRTTRSLRGKSPDGAMRFAYCAPQSSGLPRSEEHTSELQSLAYLVCR